MALVVNTNHNSFTKNLSDIVIYVLYNEGNPKQYDIELLRETIKSEVYLEFTPEELKNAINTCVKEGLIVCCNEKYVLDQEGYDRFNKDKNIDIRTLIKKYLELFNVEGYTSEEVLQLICNFLYGLLNSNIKGLMSLLDVNNNAELKVSPEDDNYSNEQKKIINDFLDWDDLDKNKVLFKLIAFSVDFCRLTTKKDTKSFLSLLKGKQFYLDANIIYRLMGINNESRKKSIGDFINKCKEAKIELLYTNLTYKELSDSFDHHVDRLKFALQFTKASPKSVRKLYRWDNDNAFYELYYQWASTNKSYGKWEEFKRFLKDELRKVVREFKPVTVLNSETYEKEKFHILCNDLVDYKLKRRGVSYRVSAEYDIQNILHLSRERKRNAKTVWEVNDYIISTDRAYANWAEGIFVGETPYVVIPSIWYSLLLKVIGRSDDDFKAYVEFMRLRYTLPTEASAKDIIYVISNLTQETNIQDRIIDILTDENKRISEDLSGETVDEIEIIIKSAYDEVLEQIRKEEYEGGYHGGYSEGSVEGYQKGAKEAKPISYDIGVRVGTLQTEKASILAKIDNGALTKKRINMAITVAGIIALILGTCWWVWFFLADDKVDKFGIIVTILSIVLGGTGSVIFRRLLCTDIETLKLKEHEKYAVDLERIEIGLKDLQN